MESARRDLQTMQAQVDALVHYEVEEHPHPGPRLVH